MLDMEILRLIEMKSRLDNPERNSYKDKRCAEMSFSKNSESLAVEIKHREKSGKTKKSEKTEETVRYEEREMSEMLGLSEIFEPSDIFEKCAKVGILENTEAFGKEKNKGESKRSEMLLFENTLRAKSLSEFNRILSDITEKLCSYGITRSVGGTKYITYAVLLKAAKPKMGMMDIYMYTSAHFKTTPKRVENQCTYACRNALKIDSSLKTVYDNVTVRDIVFKLAEELAKQYDISPYLCLENL